MSKATLWIGLPFSHSLTHPDTCPLISLKRTAIEPSFCKIHVSVCHSLSYIFIFPFCLFSVCLSFAKFNFMFVCLVCLFVSFLFCQLISILWTDFTCSGKPQKRLLFSGPATKRGGRAGLLRKNIYFLNFFVCSQSKIKHILRSCSIMLDGRVVVFWQVCCNIWPKIWHY